MQFLVKISWRFKCTLVLFWYSVLKKKKLSILKMFFKDYQTWNSLNTTILKLNLFSSNRLFNDLTLRATSLKGNHEYKTHSLWVSLYIYMNGFQIRILTVIRPLEKRSKYYSIFPHTNIEFIVTSIRKEIKCCTG